MKILVAYETGHGTTAEIAEAIGEVMREAGAEVDVVRCRKVEDASGYDAFVVGSPIWAFKWLKPATAFLKKNAELLCQRPTAIFLTSGAAAEEKGKRMAMDKWVPKILSAVPDLEPVAIGNFAGVYSFPKYNIAMRAVMMAICKSQGAPTSGTVDYRDWDEIKGWAAEVHEAFGERLGVST